MTLTLLSANGSAARKLALLLATAAVVAIGLDVTEANAAKRKYPTRDQVAYGARGPNSSYMAGPRTRVYVTKRSWLDAGTEVLPGDRHFTDYAFPPNYSFGRENRNWPLDRSPLNPASDLGGYPQRFPLY
jgi:hypothetical protein